MNCMRARARVCVCMYVCTHACRYVCVYVCMYVCMCVCTCVYMYVCMYVRTYVCMYVCTRACRYVCVCMYVYMHACRYVCVCKCVCVYVCMWMCVYVCVYVVCRPMYVCGCIYLCMYVCLFVCMYVLTYALIYYVCMYVWMCVCVYHAPMYVCIILDWGCLRRMCLTNIWAWGDGTLRYEVIHRVDCSPDIFLSPRRSWGLYGRGCSAARKCTYIYSLVKSTAFPAPPLITERTVTGQLFSDILYLIASNRTVNAESRVKIRLFH